MADKVVFLDRDGVINVKAPPYDYIKSWYEFIFLPHVAKAIESLNKAGFLIIIITNQRGVARGLMTMADVQDIHNNMCKVLARQGAVITDIFICPHADNSCECRKPKIGLFLQAEAKYQIDKRKSFMIGDSASDIEAGKKYGVRTIAIQNSQDLQADYQCADLLQAVHYILEEEQR